VALGGEAGGVDEDVGVGCGERVLRLRF